MVARKRRSTAVELPPMVELDEADTNLNVLLHSDSGTGKTVFGGGAGLIISTEKGGAISARRAGSKAKLRHCKKWEEFVAVKAWWEAEGHTQFEWTTFDSLTSMQEMMLRWILEKAHSHNSNRDLDVPDQNSHQKWQNYFKRTVGELCDIPANTLFTAQSMNIETEEGAERVMPMIMGQKGAISQYTCGLMTCIGYMRVVNTKGKEIRRIYWQSRPPYYAKDWLDALGRYTDDKGLTELSPVMNAALTGSAPTTITRTRRTGARKARSNG